jgi:hypothetical protein
VNQGERRADVVEQHARVTPRHRRAFAEVFPLEELHRVVRTRGVDAVVVDLDDARVGQLRERVKLALEQRRRFTAALLVVGGRELFERDVTPGRAVGDAVHRRHPPAADGLFDVVAVADSRGVSASASSRLGTHLPP